jgi:hypothetical protein
MTRLVLTVLVLAVTSSLASAQSRPTRFWNLTRYTVSEFYLAPAGTTNFGPNQCKNDKDGTVDHDERLRITGVDSGPMTPSSPMSAGAPAWRNIGRGRSSSIEEKVLGLHGRLTRIVIRGQ